MKVPVKSMIFFVIYTILLVLSSVLFSAYGQLTSTPAISAMFPYQPIENGLETNRDTDYSQRTLRLSTSDDLEFSLNFTTTNRNSIVDFVTAGKYQNDAYQFISTYFGNVLVTNQSGDQRSISWQAPTIERSSTDRVDINTTGRIHASNGPYKVRIAFSPCMNPPCLTSTYVSGSKIIVGIDPTSGIVKQTSTSLAVTTDLGFTTSSTNLNIDLADLGISTDPTHSIDFNLSPTAWLALSHIWRQVLIFTPWTIAFLWLQFQMTNNAGRAKKRIINSVTSMRPFLLAALVTFAAYGITWLQPVLNQVPYSDPNRHDPWNQLLPNHYPSTVGAVLGLVALWSWRVKLQRTPSVRMAIIGSKVLTLFFGMAALGIAGYSLTSDSEYFVSIQSYIYAAAIVIVCLGALGVSRRLCTDTGWILDGLCAAALVAGISILSTVSYSVTSAVVSGILTILILSTFVVTFVWSLIQSLTAPLPFRRRVRTWLEIAVILFAVAFVLPVDRSSYDVFPFSPYDAFRVAFAAEPFLRVGLIVSGIVFLLLAPLSRLPDHVWPPVAIGAMALLVLRPESNVVGIPLSLSIGVVLAAWILVRPRNHALSLFRDMDPSEVHQLLDRLRALRIGRELRAALRKRVQSGNLESGDGDKIVEMVTRILDAPTTPPSGIQRHTALGWAGTPNPMRRALMATALSTTVGVIFNVPLLAQTFSGIDLHGSSVSSTLLTGLLTFRFPFYGFVFGYFLPVFKGNSGLAKAVRYFVVLACSESIAVLVPYQPSENLAGAMTVLLVQLAMLCAILGTGADVLTLHQAKEGTERLADLYNMSRLALWSAGVLASVSTALITALLGAALTVTMHGLLPSTPPVIPIPPNSQNSQTTR